jgi:peroxisomal 3,2-trans-enoyl-CoA isomerase
MTRYQTIDVSLRDGLCVLKHNRPECLNARNSQMYAEIIAALADASEDTSVCAVMLTGSGAAFCAGMDFNNDFTMATTALADDSVRVRSVKAQLSALEPRRAVFELARKFVAAFINFDKPLIGAVNGAAIGEGFSSLLHCDVVYASPSAYFWAPFARAGAAPEFCATMLANRRLGPTLGNAALYLSRKITAAEAQRAGFVLDIVEGADFQGAVEALIQEGLALAGPADLRADTLKRFRALAYPDQERERLLAQADKEFELLARRAANGETARVQAYYSDQFSRIRKGQVKR